MNNHSVFISYSHKDEKWKERLGTQLNVLQNQMVLESWSDRRIGAGEDWEKRINNAIDGASVAIFLISAHFLTSEFIMHKEVPRLLKRQKEDGIIIVPIIVEPCVWQSVGWLKRMQLRPKDANPLSGKKRHGWQSDLTVIVGEIASAIGTADAEPTAHQKTPAKISRTVKLIDVMLDSRETVILEKAMSVVYLFCALDQIVSSGAWGKSLVKTFFMVRGESPRKLDREEGGMSTTALIGMALHGLMGEKAGESMRKSSRINQMIAKAISFFRSRWVPGEGFGSFVMVERGGTVRPQPSFRHTLAGALFLIEAGQEADLQLAADAANVAAGQLNTWLEGRVSDKCPSATAAFTCAVFDRFQQRKYGYLVAKRGALAGVVSKWEDLRSHCIAHLNQVLARAKHQPWFPPYGDFDEFLYYSCLVPWRVFPFLFHAEGYGFHINALNAVLKQVGQRGIGWAPRDAKVENKWKTPDLGTTCALTSLLMDAEILNAAKEHGLITEVYKKRKLLITALDNMLKTPKGEHFDLLCCEDACGILSLAKNTKCRIAPRTIERLDALVNAIGQSNNCVEIRKLAGRAGITMQLLNSIVGAAVC